MLGKKELEEKRKIFEVQLNVSQIKVQQLIGAIAVLDELIPMAEQESEDDGHK